MHYIRSLSLLRLSQSRLSSEIPFLLTSTDRLIALTLTMFAFAVYLRTLTPSLSYFSIDSNELATLPSILGVVHGSTYPLYTWLGFLFSHLLPFGDVAHRMNLMSAILGAASIGGLYMVTIQLMPSEILSPDYRRSIATTGALLFAFSRTFWSQAVIAEVYAPNMAFIALTLLLLLYWNYTRRNLDFFFFAFAFGLSLGTHISNLGFAPGLMLFVVITIAGASRLPTGSALIRLGIVAVVGLAGFGLGTLQFILWPPHVGILKVATVLQDLPIALINLYRDVQLGFNELRQVLSLMPPIERLLIYFDWLRIQFGLIGIMLGIIGLFFQLIHRLQFFCLLVGMYIVHLWFFTQYKVFDFDVFFLPTHFLWTIFIAIGLAVTWMGIVWLVQFFRLNISLTSLINTGLVLIMPLSCIVPLVHNWSQNDFSMDVAINDFYATVWEYIPPNAALITRSGVFGYDAFYWQMIYQTRQDVLLPFLQNLRPEPKELSDRDLYATESAVFYSRIGGALGPPNLIDPSYWKVPVILGGQPRTRNGHGEPLVLYRISALPPSLLVVDPRPKIPINVNFGSVVLIGIDLNSIQVESGDAVHLVLYWKLEGEEPTHVTTSLGNISLEQHEVGFNLLSRYRKEVELPSGSIVADRYWLVIPSTIPPGVWPLTLSKLGQSNQISKTTLLATLEVVNQLGTMERWLRIAKK